MNSVSRATVLSASASELDSDSPLAPEFGQKEILPLAWLDANSSQDGKTQKLLDRLEAENTRLRERVIELLLEIRSLRDGHVEWRGYA